MKKLTTSMKKSFLAGSGILIAAAMVNFYPIGLHHGSTGEGLLIGEEAVAAQEGNAFKNSRGRTARSGTEDDRRKAVINRPG